MVEIPVNVEEIWVYKGVRAEIKNRNVRLT